MATYKKRGNKVRKPKLNDNNDFLSDVEFDGESSTQEIFDSLDETASKSEEWVEKNQKIIYTVLGVLLISLLGYLAYGKFVSGPKEIKAADQLAFSKSIFTAAENATSKKDSLYNVALNGADNQFGLLKISEKYAGTKAANMANYMAGIAYLNMDKYENGIKFLSKFSSDDAVLGPLAKGKIGDAFADINQLSDAYDYYKQALNLQGNSLTTPLYLFKAANTAMEIGKFGEALKMFERIQTSYPKSEEAKSIGVYINRAKYASK